MTIFYSQIDDAGLDVYETRILLRIIRRVGGTSSGKCTESLANIAAATGISRRKVAMVIKSLQLKKIISVVSGAVNHSPSAYRVMPVAEWCTSCTSELEEKSTGAYPAPIAQDALELVHEMPTTGAPDDTELVHEMHTEEGKIKNNIININNNKKNIIILFAKEKVEVVKDLGIPINWLDMVMENLGWTEEDTMQSWLKCIAYWRQRGATEISGQQWFDWVNGRCRMLAQTFSHYKKSGAV